MNVETMWGISIVCILILTALVIAFQSGSKAKAGAIVLGVMALALGLWRLFRKGPTEGLPGDDLSGSVDYPGRAPEITVVETPSEEEVEHADEGLKAVEDENAKLKVQEVQLPAHGNSPDLGVVDFLRARQEFKPGEPS